MLTYWRRKLDSLRTALQQEAGFTLIEVMVVAAILVMLAGVAAPQLFKAFEDARLQKLEVDAKQILSAVDREVLNARLKGTSVGNITDLVLTPSVISGVYGLNISAADGATFKYSYTAADGKSFVVVTYNSKTYNTNEGKWNP